MLIYWMVKISSGFQQHFQFQGHSGIPWLPAPVHRQTQCQIGNSAVDCHPAQSWQRDIRDPCQMRRSMDQWTNHMGRVCMYTVCMYVCKHACVHLSISCITRISCIWCISCSYTDKNLLKHGRYTHLYLFKRETAMDYPNYRLQFLMPVCSSHMKV